MFMMFNKNNDEDNNTNNDSMLNCKTIKEKQQLLRKKVYDIIFDPDTELNIKNPSNAPTIIKQNIAISWYPSTQPDPYAIIPKVKNAIADNPAASPSKPSVKLTALEPPNNMNNIKKPYNQPISIFIFNVYISRVGLFPLFI